MRRKRRGVAGPACERKRSRCGRFTRNASDEDTIFIVEGSSLPTISHSDSDGFIVVEEDNDSLVGASNILNDTFTQQDAGDPSSLSIFPLIESLRVITTCNDEALHGCTNITALISTDHICAKCLRESTVFYPLSLQLVTVGVSRKYGTIIPPGSCVTLCELCQNYVSIRPVWRNAWPAVLCTMIFSGAKYGCNGEYLFNLLPFSIAYSWLSVAKSSGFFIDSSLPLFNDFTLIENEFVYFMSQYRAEHLKKYFNFFTFPFVKCPAGCSALVKEADVISFKHLLNRWFPVFDGFHADGSKLTSMRKDYLSSVLHLDEFLSSPCLSVDEDGLNLRTCRLHGNSLPLKMFHLPRSPLGNLIHPESDRLAVMATKLRVVTPCKFGPFSSSFTMATSVGGPGGISSTILTTKRRLNVKSEHLLPENELLMFLNRADIRSFLGRLLNDNEVGIDFLSFFDQQSSVSDSCLSEHLETATYMTTFASLAIKTYLEKVDTTPLVVPSLCVCHYFDSYGATPILPRLKIADNVSLYLCCFLFNNHEFFGHLLMNVMRCQHVFIKLLIDVSQRTFCDTNDALQIFSSNFKMNFLLPPSAAPLSLLTQVFERLASCDLKYCPSRESLVFLEDSSAQPSVESAKNDVYSLLVLGPMETGRRSEIPVTLTAHGKLFHLSLIYCNNKSIFFRYCFQFTSWWMLDSTKRIAVKTVESPYSSFCQRSWQLLLYLANYQNLLLSEARNLFFSCQDSIFCSEHKLPLSVDCFPEGKLCYLENCSKSIKWSCPKVDCFASCCRTHFKTLSRLSDKQFILSRELPVQSQPPSPQMSVSSESDSEYGDEEFTFEFEGLTETGLFHEPLLESEASVHLPTVENANSNVPLHVLLNDTLTVFKRNCQPHNLSQKFLRYFQNFAACNPEDVVSFLQPEALLCPSVFYKQLDDGSFLGALPYFLLNDAVFNKKLEFASFYDHVYSRITNMELPVAANIKYCYFLTDVLLNSNLHSTVTNHFFKRGIQNVVIAGQKLHFISSSFSFCLVDADTNVRELAAAMRQSPPTLFVTLTLNQKEHFGIAPLVNAIHTKFPDKTSEEFKAAMQAYMPVILRMWDLTIRQFLEYLLYSEEHLLGRIINLWGRCEFQSKVGNVPHYHFLFWLSDTDGLENLIVSARKHIQLAFEQLLDCTLGLLNDRDEMEETVEKFMTIHTHDCDKGNNRCKVRVDTQGNLRCRFPPYEPSNTVWLKEIPVQYSDDALKVLKDLGLCYVTQGEDVLAEDLKCFKFSYPAVKGEHVMPNSASMFALTKSSGNILLITKLMSAKYLNKYAAGKEEHCQVTIKSGSSIDNYQVKSDEIENNKTTRVRLLKEMSNDKKRSVAGIQGLNVAQTEFLWWSLRLPAIITTFNFINVPSVPLEDRGAAAKHGGLCQCADILSNRENLDLPSTSHFTKNQMCIIADNLKSELTTDNVTKFSMRPPELLCIKRLLDYFSFFFRSKPIPPSRINMLLRKKPTPWVDGLNCQVKMRPAAIPAIEELALSMDSCCARVQLFSNVLNCLSDESYYNTYVENEAQLSKTPAIVVFSNVFPKEGLKFLFHLLLTMGEFETELDLFSHTSLRECFVAAKILRSSTAGLSEANRLLRRYLFEQLIYLPGGSMSFSSRLVAARDAIYSLVLEDSIGVAEYPCVLMEHLTNQAEHQINTHVKSCFRRLYDTLKPVNVTNRPDEMLQNYSTVWMPAIVCLNQFSRSFAEQCEVLDNLFHSLLKFMRRNSEQVLKHHIVLGKPGSGNCHVCSIALLFAMNNGLNCYVTSLAARRSAGFSCDHIHRLFCIDTNEKSDPAAAANKSVRRLSFEPKKRALLMLLDVLVIEEIGLVNAELLTTMDLILRTLRSSNMSFGGIFLIANGDTKQLPSFTGTDFFLSPSLLFAYRCHFLKFYVRMHDICGQTLLDLISLKPVPVDVIRQIISTIGNKCSFVDDWNDLPDGGVMKVFGKREAVRQAVTKHQHSITSSGQPYVTFQAVDECRTRHSSIWRAASPEASKKLDKECREPRNLVLYQHCFVRLTVNQDDLCQGQICVLADLPDATANSIPVFVAPNIEVLSSKNLIANELFRSWPLKKVGKVTGFVVPMGNSSLRRTQFPFDNYVASTCHKLMGDTFQSIATQVSATEGPYALWLTSQLYVIISRVNQLKNVFFVGSRYVFIPCIY